MGKRIAIFFWRIIAWLFCTLWVGHEEPTEASHARACLRRLPEDFEVKIHLAQISCARCGFMMDVKNVTEQRS